MPYLETVLLPSRQTFCVLTLSERPSPYFLFIVWPHLQVRTHPEIILRTQAYKMELNLNTMQESMRPTATPSPLPPTDTRLRHCYQGTAQPINGSRSCVLVPATSGLNLAPTPRRPPLGRPCSPLRFHRAQTAAGPAGGDAVCRLREERDGQ